MNFAIFDNKTLDCPCILLDIQMHFYLKIREEIYFLFWDYFSHFLEYDRIMSLLLSLLFGVLWIYLSKYLFYFQFHYIIEFFKYYFNDCFRDSSLRLVSLFNWVNGIKCFLGFIESCCQSSKIFVDVALTIFRNY